MQSVEGDGFRFEVPAGWTVKHKPGSITAISGPVDLLQAQHFKLEKPYRPALFTAVAHELDDTADHLAQQSSGRVGSSKTVQVAGRKTRFYAIDYDLGKTEEIAFVLSGLDEYQVLCRRASSASDADCARLFSTFSLG